MINLLSNIKIKVNKNIYIKDPDTSDLGRKILSESILLIYDLGFEEFTFRKLSAHIGATETSIYRYFESKHKLLLFLASWYWGWLEYRLVFALSNIPSAEERLNRSITIITEGETLEVEHPYLDIKKLSQIIIAESSKTYLTRNVDKENEDGVFEGYKQLVRRISDIILEINPEFPFPHMLISTVIEGAHQQRFFADHLPALTDSLHDGDAISAFYVELVRKTISTT
jgi:AcrR family transcriptional regulator